MKRSNLNSIVDAMTGITFIITTLSFEDFYLHIAAGLFMTSGVVVHLALHRKWIVIQTKKMLRSYSENDARRKRKRKNINFNYILDLFIGIMFVISTFSGIALIVLDDTSWISMHRSSSWLLVIGALAHITLHWRWILNMIRITVSRSPLTDNATVSRS